MVLTIDDATEYLSAVATLRTDPLFPLRWWAECCADLAYPGEVNLLRRAGKVSLDKSDEYTQVASDAAATADAKREGKGRPTPKRRDAQGERRGPIAPPPKTQREAAKRSKEGTKSLSKDERRALTAERRERMKRGDDAYLMARDKGKVRAWVRDQVDTRRNLAGMLMPLAVLSFVVLLVPNPLVQTFGPFILIIAILASVADGIVFGRRLARDVRQEFPKGDGSNLSATGRALGFYAFNRAMMPRRWRVPKPRVGR